MAQGLRDKTGWRRAAVLGLLGAGVAVHYLGGPFATGMLIWFLLAAGIGALVRSPWGILLMAVPWPLGVGLGLLTGQYAFLGDGWQGVAGLSALLGVAGAILGFALGSRIRAYTVDKKGA